MSTLPFLKRKDVASPGISVKIRTPDESPESDENDSDAGLESCGQAMLQAIKSNDPKGLANAIKDLMDIGDSDETPESHSYDAQNQSAGDK